MAVGMAANEWGFRRQAYLELAMRALQDAMEGHRGYPEALWLFPSGVPLGAGGPVQPPVEEQPGVETGVGAAVGAVVQDESPPAEERPTSAGAAANGGPQPQAGLEERPPSGDQPPPRADSAGIPVKAAPAQARLRSGPV